MREFVRRAPAAYLGYVFIGCSALLLPSISPQLRLEFGVTDGALGLLFLIGAIAYTLGALGAGFLEGVVGRRTLLVACPAVMGVGAAFTSVAPTFPVLLLLAPLSAAGGAFETVANASVIDIGTTRRAGAVNLLHFGWSAGALMGPIAVALILGAGGGWRAAYLLTFGFAVVIVLLAAFGPVPARPPASATRDRSGRLRGATIDPVFVALAVAIAAYVGAELGVSNWLVRFLEQAPAAVATASLSLFWAGLTFSRLVSARFAHRFPPMAFAATLSAVAGVLVVAAVLAPQPLPSILLFVASGLAFGPVYPTIIAAAGDRYPDRAPQVTGLLVSISILGAVIYPPFMGVVSDTAGLAVAMTGIGIVCAVCTAALLIARRLAALPRR